MALRPTRHKIRHFGDAFFPIGQSEPISWLVLVLVKQNERKAVEPNTENTN